MSFIKSEEELRQKLAELYKRQQESWNEEQTRLQEARKDVNWVSPSQLPSYAMPDRPAESEFQKFLGDVYGGSVTRMANNTWDKIKKQYDEEVYKASNQYKAMQILQEQQKQENEKRLQDFIQNSGVKAPTQNVQLPTAENSSSNMEQFRINQFNYQQQKQEDAVKQSIDTLKKNGQIRLATEEERKAILEGGEEINDKAMEKAREYADKAKRGDMSWKTELYLNSIPAGAKRDIAGLEQLGLTAGEIFAGITGNEDAEIDIRRKKQNIRARGNEYAQTREYLKRMLNAQGQGDVWNDIEDMLAGAFENTSAVAFNTLIGAGLNGSQVMANPNLPLSASGGDIGTVLQGVEAGVDAFTGRQQRTNNENPVGNFIASTWEGTMNTVWEKATGGNILTRKLGKNAVGETVVQNAGWLDKYLFNAIKKTGINNKTALNVINKAWGFLGEVVEEWGTDLSTEIGNRIVLNEKSVKNLDELVAKEGETAKQTLFSTLIMNLFGMGSMKTKDIANQYGIEYGTVDDIQHQMKEYAREHNMSLTEKSVDKIMNEFMKEAGLNFNEIVNNYDELMNQKEGMEETGYPKQYANPYQERYYESAKKYNLPNNEVMQAIQELGEKRGYKVEYNADKFKNSNEESIWSKNDRTVYINPSVDSRTQLTKLAVHEMFHDTMGSDSHAKLINTIMEKLQADTKNYEKNRKSIMEAYKDQLKGLNEQQANQLIAEEMTAKYLGENLGSRAFVNELVQTTDRNTIERFIDWITNRIQQLKNIVTGNKEAEYWRGIRENLIKAYNSQYQADTQDTNINYYSKEDEDYDMAESRLDRRETINYYLKKGEFEQAEKLIKEYGLEDERNEFMEGLDYGAQHEYKDYLEDAELNRLMNDKSIVPYSPEDYARRDKMLARDVRKGYITEEDAEIEKYRQAWTRDEISREEFDKRVKLLETRKEYKKGNISKEEYNRTKEILNSATANKTPQTIVDDLLSNNVNNRYRGLEALVEYVVDQEEFNKIDIRQLNPTEIAVKDENGNKIDIKLSDYTYEKIKDKLEQHYNLQSPTEQSVKALNRIDDLADEGQHYTNAYSKEALAKKGRQDGRIDFEQYINQLRQESYEKRNDYHKGDIIEYDTNARGVTEQWHQGQIQAVEKAIATHGDPNPDVVYTVKDQDTGKVYNIDAYEVSKLIKKGQDNNQAYKTIINDALNKTQEGNWIFDESDLKGMDFDTFTKMLKKDSRVADVEIDNKEKTADVVFYTENLPVTKSYDKIINDALKNTTSGNWTIENSELEKNGILPSEFEEKLDNDERVSDYIKEKDGYDVNFYTKYTPNVDNDGYYSKKTNDYDKYLEENSINEENKQWFEKQLEKLTKNEDMIQHNAVLIAEYKRKIENLNQELRTIQDNVNLPTTDSQGNTLSKQQQERFKNSKVRDNKGRLLIVYHGTPNGGFNVYDTTKAGTTTGAKDSTLGIHFTDNKDMATQFVDAIPKNIQEEISREVFKENGIDYDSLDGGQKMIFLLDEANQNIVDEIEKRLQEYKNNKTGEVKEQYLNITKPLSIFADYGISEQQLADDIVYITTGEHDISEVTNYYEDSLEMLNDLQHNFNNELGELKDELAKPEAIERAKELGYDGVIFPIQKPDAEGLAELKVQGGDEYKDISTGGNEYVIFNSNQAKNIDNRNPTDNPDIRYSKKADEFDKYLKETSINEDNQGHKVKPAMQRYMRNSKARVNEDGQLDENGNLAVVYHTTTDEVKQFNEFNPVGTRGYRFGDQVVNFYTDSEEMSDSYSDFKSSPADTRKITTIKQAKEYAKEQDCQIIENSDGTYTLIDQKDQLGYDRAKEIINDYFTKEEQETLQKILKTLDNEKSVELNDNEEKVMKKRKELENKVFDQELGEISYETQVHILNFLKPNSSVYYIFDNDLRPMEIKEKRKVFNSKEDLLRNIVSEINGEDYWQYTGYVNITNPYVVDAENKQWSNVERTSSKGIEALIETIPDEQKLRLNNLYADSTKAHNDALNEYHRYQRIGSRILDTVNPKVDGVVSAIYRLAHDDGLTYGRDYGNNYEQLKQLLGMEANIKHKYEGYLPRDPIFWEDLAYALEKGNIISSETQEQIIEQKKLPTDIQNMLSEAFDKQIKVDGYEGTIDQLIKESQEAYNETAKYPDEDSYFAEKIRKGTYTNDPVNFDLEKVKRILGVSKDEMGDYANRLARATSVDFDRKELSKWWGKSKTTNDIVNEVLESNKAGKTNYDGIIIKNVYDYGGIPSETMPANVYITFNSNQFKAIDNQSPTTDADIRYNRQAKVYDDYLKKNSINTSNEASMRDLLLPKQEQINLPTTEVTKRKGTKPKKVKQELPVANEEVILPTAEKTQEKTQTKKATENLPTMAETIDWSEIEKPENNKKFRKFYISIINSPNTTAEAKAIAKKLLGLDTYVPDSNQKQLMRADLSIQQLGAKESLEGLKYKLLQNERITATDVAIGERLIEYASKIGDSQMLQDAIETTAIMGTQTGQALQALAILNRQTPTGQVTAIQRAVEKLNAELQMKYAKKGRKAPQFNFTNEMQQRIMKAKNTDQLYEIVDKVYKELGQQVPKTTMEQLDEWRYFSMLANARTHARNMIGNLGMHGVQRFKDKLAGLIEDTVARFNPDMERMHTLKRVDKKTKEFAKKDLERREVQSQLGMTEDKYHPQSRLQGARRVFKHNLLEKTIGGLFRLNSKALSVEDDIGLKAMYKKALGEYLTANGIDVDKITDKQLAKARNYAVEQSKKATFHQASALASAMTQLSNKNNVSKFFLDATVPFKKTPINVAKTGIEYSPIGIIKSMTYDISQVRNGNMSGAQYIDNLSKGLTGSGLMFVGYVLASMGLLKASGPEDKKKEELEDQQGKQRYSLQFGDDVSISLDWFAPSGIPFFIGAELYEQQNQAKKEKNRNENESDLDVGVRNTGKLLNSLSSAMNPMSEMSMIQGITSVLASYNQDQAVGDMITNSFKSYVGQYVPTLFGQITKTADEYERSTKSTKTGTFERAFDQTLNQIKSKLPIARQTLPIKTDIWGNDIKQTDNIPLRILNNFINPATVKEITSDDKVNSELNRLYDQTGNTSVVPTSIAKKVTIDSKDYFFNNEEYAKYQKQYGQTAHKLLDNLVNSAEYKKLNNTQKARAVSNIYDYAKEKNKVDYAKDNKISGVKPSSNYKALDELTDKVKTAYLTYEAKTSDLKKKDERLQVLLDSNYTDFQKRKIYEYSKDGSDDFLFQFSNEMNPDEYLSYKLADIQGEKDANGKTKSGTKKKADLNYINNNISGYYNRLVLMADNYKLSRAQQKDLANYINQADPEEAIKMFKELPLNFKVDANGRVYYK